MASGPTPSRCQVLTGDGKQRVEKCRHHAPDVRIGGRDQVEERQPVGNRE